MRFLTSPLQQSFLNAVVTHLKLSSSGLTPKATTLTPCLISSMDALRTLVQLLSQREASRWIYFWAHPQLSPESTGSSYSYYLLLVLLKILQGILVTGGKGRKPSGEFESSTEIYLPSTGQWTAASQLVWQAESSQLLERQIQNWNLHGVIFQAQRSLSSRNSFRISD